MADISSVAALINSIQVVDASEFIALFQYLGFNPDMVLEHLAKMKQEKNISDAQFKKDMQALVSIGVIMGNYNDNNSAKISDKGKELGDSLIIRYNLKKGAIGKDKKAVNIPRILATFPILTHRFTMKCASRNYGGPLGADSLPLVIKTGVFPALIPGNVKGVAVLLAASCCYTSEQSAAISGRRGLDKEAMKPFLSAQMNFTEISHKSPVPSQKERLEHYAVIKGDLMKHFSSIVEVAAVYKELTGAKFSIPSDSSIFDL